MFEKLTPIQLYKERMAKEIKEAYKTAEEARKKGYDPEDKVDIPLVTNMAERVEGIISVAAPQIINSGVSKRIKELEKKYCSLDWRVAFTIALEVAHEKFCKFKDKITAMEIGIRTGFAYITMGVVASPLEGFVSLRVGKTMKGEEYLAANYAGPIRSAGGTGASVGVLIADYIRKQFGYAAYDPTEEEIERTVTELYDYHDRITNLQYLPSEEEIRFLASRIPIQIDGDGSEKIEVSRHKNLARIETNQIRNGICLVIGEGIAQKAPKLWKQLSKWGKDFGIEWDFLEEFVDLQKKIKSQGIKEGAEEVKIKPDFTFIKDLAAGRPVLTHPMHAGGFRLRYGRARTSGYSSNAIHPATMYVLEDFLATGTQLKSERPGKGCTVTHCDELEGPIVKLKNGNVVKVNKIEDAKQLSPEVEEILFLGDMLINYGDFFNRAHTLVPPGYCEEWWVQEVEKATVDMFGSLDTEKLAELVEIPAESLRLLFKNPNETKIAAKAAIILSKKLNVPLHPAHTHHWGLIHGADILNLLEALDKSKQIIEEGKLKKIVMPNLEGAKKALEDIGAEHIVASNEYIVLARDTALAIPTLLGLEDKNIEEVRKIVEQNKELTGLEIIKLISPIRIRDKSGVFIGARMGRPEKAKQRKLTGSPQVLFPVGEEGGRLRSFQAALEAGSIRAEMPVYKCTKCNEDSVYKVCDNCGKRTKEMRYCKICGIIEKECEHGTTTYKLQDVPIKRYFERALKIMGVKIHADLIKGVRGMSNKGHIPENLTKGLIRAKWDVYVNKDGTTRYDMTQLPITHFKPNEIGTSVEKLKELGYEKDAKGKPLQDGSQVVEIKPQDIILPKSQGAADEGADKVLFRVTKFIDEMLQTLYKQKPFYNLEKEEDLVGHLVLCLAPHTSAAITARIIGFSQTQGFFAHPMLHAATRRDCVHPQTRFIYTKENIIENCRIGEYVENLLQMGASTKTLDNEGTLRVDCKDDIYVFGVSPENKRLKKKRVKYFIKGPKPENWVKITTATNREYIMTPTHDFMHVEDNKFCFKKAKDINIGDKVPLLNNFQQGKQTGKLNLIRMLIEKLPESQLKKIYLSNEAFFKEFIKKHREKLKEIADQPHYLYRWHICPPLSDIKKLTSIGLLDYDILAKKTRVRVNFALRTHSPYLIADENLASLLGYYSAEGYCRQTKTVSQVSFRVQEKGLQDKIIYLIKKVFGISPNLGEDSTKITICDQLVYNLFRYCFNAGSGAYTKRVPPIIFNLNNKLAAKYVSSFLDGEGSIILQNNSIAFYSVSRTLIDDIALVLARFNVFSKYHTTKPRLPGKKVLEKYKKLGKIPKKHVLHHLIINGRDSYNLKKVLTLNSKNKLNKLNRLKIRDIPRKTFFEKKQCILESINDIVVDYVKSVEVIRDSQNSFCLEINWENEGDKNILWGEQILNTRCDGDEASVNLLMDSLLNFSRQYLPAHRGATQDAPLVLTSDLIASEVDDMIFDMDIVWKYPLEFYNACLEYKKPWDVEIEQVSKRLGTGKEYDNIGYTHETNNMNEGVKVSAYKTLPSMEEKVEMQMKLATKIRAVDKRDVAKLVIEKHFIRDTKGNLRKFSMQIFRCVGCNEKYRRPPLIGKCLKCGGKIIFTISEGGITKYLDLSIRLAKEYDASPYLKQTLDLVKKRVEEIFGKVQEKQEGLGAFMA